MLGQEDITALQEKNEHFRCILGLAMRMSRSLQRMTFKERLSELVLLRVKTRILNRVELTAFKYIKGCFRKKKNDLAVHGE